MADALGARGPDGGGLWQDSSSGIAIAHRIHSVGDRLAQAQQPIVSACGRYVLICDGEVYNAEEIFLKLVTAGRAQTELSDARVLVEAMAVWGIEAALRHLNAAFAGAVWDREVRVLHLFRDRFGMRPLYWTEAKGVFLFGSTPRAFRTWNDFVPVLDRDTLAAYLRRRCVPGPYSIYRGVQMLPPGSILSIAGDGEPKIQYYWRLEDAVRAGQVNRFSGSEIDAVGQLDWLLRDAVARRTGKDCVSVLFSGGIDSSVLLAMLQTVAPGRAHGVTIGFHEREFDEAEQAGTIARHLGVSHDVLHLSPSHVSDLMPQLADIYDEPTADVAQIPELFAFKLARRGSSAAFAGDGGDEFFTGYEAYLEEGDLLRHLGRLPAPARGPVEAVIRAAPASFWAHFSKALPTALRPLRLADKVTLVMKLLTGDAEDAWRMIGSYWHNPDSVVIGGRERASLAKDLRVRDLIPDPVERMKYLITQTVTTDGALTKLDRAASATGIELRMPLLDHRVAEFSWTLPASMKLRGRTNKWLLRQLAYRYFPQAIIDRPKAGLDVPMGLWLRGPLRGWAETLLGEKRLASEGIFHPGRIRARWQEHLAGRRDWGASLWVVLMFQIWKERWLP